MPDEKQQPEEATQAPTTGRFETWGPEFDRTFNSCDRNPETRPARPATRQKTP